ncbi:2-oxoglutarate and iron-dependent oxygenase domain-containing protein [uncultured Algimonas sp.]|uniref:isopenicillin N synthase family dioxygenase n=1 Tax=uncultured Algimonas sp. TaxID=1547920 RepID=UPI002611AE05|nr:2-oxoglutarate and iron-dependent oxygenase domain-containing protein [uncultured Algimonas sp.]
MTQPRIAELDFRDHAGDPAAFGRRLVDGMRETGFIVIRNHALPQPAIEAAQAASETFFALPEAAKTRYALPEHHFQRGYSPFGQESAKGRDAPDLKEFWHVGRSTIPGLPGTPSVGEVPEFDSAGRTLFDAMDDFARTLMVAIGKTLDMTPEALRAALENGNSILRLLHYPPMPERPGSATGSSVRAAEHEDINLLTLLLGAEEAGLEVKHRSGVWLPINAPAGSLVVNAGDMLDRLTGGVIPSTTHRVVNPTTDRSPHSRYSMPFFLHPANDFPLEALPSCLEMGGKAKDPITARGYLDERLREIGLAKA